MKIDTAELERILNKGNDATLKLRKNKRGEIVVAIYENIIRKVCETEQTEQKAE